MVDFGALGEAVMEHDEDGPTPFLAPLVPHLSSTPLSLSVFLCEHTNHAMSGMADSPIPLVLAITTAKPTHAYSSSPHPKSNDKTNHRRPQLGVCLAIYGISSTPLHPFDKGKVPLQDPRLCTMAQTSSGGGANASEETEADLDAYEGEVTRLEMGSVLFGRWLLNVGGGCAISVASVHIASMALFGRTACFLPFSALASVIAAIEKDCQWACARRSRPPHQAKLLTDSDNDHRYLALSPTTLVLSMPSKKGKNRAKRKNREGIPNPLQQGSQTPESPSAISQSAGVASSSTRPAVDQCLIPDPGRDQGTSQRTVTSVILYRLADASSASAPQITNIYNIGNVNTGPIYGTFACRQMARLLKLNGFRHTDHDIGERRRDGMSDASVVRVSLL
jgi:hypothetical protein